MGRDTKQPRSILWGCLCVVFAAIKLTICIYANIYDRDLIIRYHTMLNVSFEASLLDAIGNGEIKFGTRQPHILV